MAQTDPMANALLKQLSRLEVQRQTWEDLWQDIADYVVPRKADITKKRTPGDKRTDRLYDATAIHAAELLSASLHGMLTNATMPWFSLRFRNQELDGNDEAREWLQGIEDVMYQALARSNFQEQIHELYHDLITFGTGVMMVEQDDDQMVRFSTRHISECYLSEDENGRVDTVFRKFKIPARAALRKFGAEAVSQKIQKIAEEDPYETVELVHVVRPREERDPTMADSANMPWLSCYLDPESKTKLSESGYEEFLYVCPRYLKASFELGYGRSPASSSLPDIKMLNRMSEVTIRAAQKQVAPPLMVPDDGFMLPIRMVPGGINYYRSGTRDRLEPLNIGANNPLGLNMEEQRREAIRQSFYVDQLIMGVSGATMTATEVVQRTEEKMRLLGPVLGRLQAELLQPLIERVYMVLRRQDVYPDMPEVLMEAKDFRIEYVSPLAKAQRAGDATQMARLLEMILPLTQIDPGVLDHLDVDGMVKHIVQSLGIPASAVRGEEEIVERREKREQEMAAQQELAQVSQMAQAAGDAAPMVKQLGGPEGMALAAEPAMAAE